jgi:hypothetical protein
MFGSFSISLLALPELEAIFERPPYTGQDSWEDEGEKE